MAAPAPAGSRTRRRGPESRGAAAADRLRPRGLGHVLLAAVALFLVAFLAWARWATLDEVTRGDARVIPSRQIQVVQNLEGGIVAAILVREGEVVDEGQVVMRIDNVRAASDYREKRARYLALLAAAARLRAEVDEAAPRFAPEVLAEAPALAENELALFRSRQAQARRRARASCAGRRSSASRSWPSSRPGCGQLERSLPLAAEELAADAERGRRGAQGRPAAAAAPGQRPAGRARAGPARRAARPDRRCARRRSGSRARSRPSAPRRSATLNAHEAELAGLREVVLAGEDRVRRTEVRSPVHGTIKKLKVNTIGGVVQPGADLVEIVPLEDTLLVEAQVRPADIAFLAPGLPAMVKITAYDFSIYGGLDGEVEDISADSIANERGESFYRVRVRTDRNHLGAEAEPLRIIPGMTAQVDVLTGREDGAGLPAEADPQGPRTRR